ncbi:MAG: DUF1588 domain-containing protein [Rubripirellula sp.]
MLTKAFRIVMLFATFSVACSKLSANESVEMAAVRTALLEHCVDCHNSETAEGEVRFDNLPELSSVKQLDMLNRAEDQVFFKLMPPEDSSVLPNEQRVRLRHAIGAVLQKNQASDLEQRMRQPGYGNFIDHETLFSGAVTEKPFTPARRWLVSPQIFHERVNDVFKLEGGARQRKFYGVTNPIVLPDNSGVRYFDSTSLDGGHLLMMLNNADWISRKQIFAALNKGVPRGDLNFKNMKDRWYPAEVPEPFVVVVKKTGAASQTEMVAAIQAQFDCVLQRPASDTELSRYLDFMVNAISVGGNVEGLRQMLVSVLLESEFLYRLEFGSGKPDEDGRKKLSPREASYAIAYALTDRGPDDALRTAVQQGRLSNQEDLRREVTRMLDDKTSYFAEVSPTVSSGYVKPHKVTHPKIVRFFREFFGYPNSMKLFKDMARSGGFFDNAGRDYTGTAGSITNEADRVVDDVLKADKNVFERLLTTDEFYVLHPRSNSEGKRLIESWRRAYDELKEIDWRKNTEQVLAENFEEHREAFEAIRITKLTEDRERVNVRDFKRFMEYFENTFGRGITPITFPWFYHGGQKFRYSEIYSLPRVPGGGPIGSSGKYRDELAWDYPVEQPFKINHRMGILTHPAWLLAHSQNTETDIVRRGRWVREKLLAGRVPDVPITVDAQIPEDHERTLRERLDSVTSKQQCWKCHRQMNPLGLAFEVFDDFGRYRSEENLEAPENLIRKGNGKTSADVFKTKPVDATGFLDGTGDAELDGEVEDAFELIEKLSKSERVRQSIIRHAFRFFLGRNEMLSDSQTLIDADHAYVESEGSFNAVIVSLLSSDSFLYRKAWGEEQRHIMSVENSIE